MMFALGSDPFDLKETDPTKTNAIDSSLWELYSHRNHYHSVVSTLVKVLGEAFTKPHYAMEDFLDHTYTTVRVYCNHRLITQLMYASYSKPR